MTRPTSPTPVSVTAALIAKSRPSTDVGRVPAAGAADVMLTMAITVPTVWEPPIRVADEPTCQKTFSARAPFSRMTWPVTTSVEPHWKTQTASGALPASRVRVVVIAKLEGAL
jgi:hypothetical protein